MKQDATKFVGTLFPGRRIPFETWDLYNHRALSRRMDQNSPEEPQGVIRSRPFLFLPLVPGLMFFHLGAKHHIMAFHVEHIRPEDSRLQASISAVLSKSHPTMCVLVFGRFSLC